MSTELKEKLYRVVFRNPDGQVSWTPYQDQSAFEEWYKGTMSDGKTNLRDVYEIVAQGVESNQAASSYTSIGVLHVNAMVRDVRAQRIAAGLPVGERPQRGMSY